MVSSGALIEEPVMVSVRLLEAVGGGSLLVLTLFSKVSVRASYAEEVLGGFLKTLTERRGVKNSQIRRPAISVWYQKQSARTFICKEWRLFSHHVNPTMLHAGS
jgi:hypothetical protein